MVDSVKSAISRIETPKARKADAPSAQTAQGQKQHRHSLRLPQAIPFS